MGILKVVENRGSGGGAVRHIQERQHRAEKWSWGERVVRGAAAAARVIAARKTDAELVFQPRLPPHSPNPCSKSFVKRANTADAGSPKGYFRRASLHFCSVKPPCHTSRCRAKLFSRRLIAGCGVSLGAVKSKRTGQNISIQLFRSQEVIDERSPRILFFSQYSTKREHSHQVSSQNGREAATFSSSLRNCHAWTFNASEFFSKYFAAPLVTYTTSSPSLAAQFSLQYCTIAQRFSLIFSMP